jgi:hypothetical protein
MEDEVKLTMYCASCDQKYQVLEGEVTCPDCGALLDVPPEDTKFEKAEEEGEDDLELSGVVPAEIEGEDLTEGEESI